MRTVAYNHQGTYIYISWKILANEIGLSRGSTQDSPSCQSLNIALSCRILSAEQTWRHISVNLWTYQTAQGLGWGWGGTEQDERAARQPAKLYQSCSIHSSSGPQERPETGRITYGLTINQGQVCISSPGYENSQATPLYPSSGHSLPL